MAEAELRVRVQSDRDIVMAARTGRALATWLGFSRIDATLIATAIAELARNIVRYAGSGEIGLSTEARGPRGLVVVKRAMDEIEIVSAVGQGTTVTARKWKR